MKQVLIELDSDTAAALERVAPARSRRRSEFIRAAIRRAIWDLEERATRDAYLQTPDDAPPHFAPDLWDARVKPRPRGRSRR